MHEGDGDSLHTHVAKLARDDANLFFVEFYQYLAGCIQTTIDLETLLAESPAARKKWVKDQADRALSDKVNKAVN